MLTGLAKLARLMASPQSRQKIKESLARIYAADVSQRHGMESKDIDEIIALARHSFHLTNLEYEKGHTTRTELLYVLAIVKDRLRPGNHFLEIGTFNGNTALNLSLNLPEGSRLYTLDLPHADGVGAQQLAGDQAIIDSDRRKQKKHLGRPNVEQIYIDSREFDFSSVKFQGAFIDGGHAYSIVKSDSEGVLKNIQRPGFVLWHDYDGVNEVSAAIHELRRTHPIVRVKGTALCFLDLK